ncbi:MAG: sigma-70 family RNA polymerase sigma factor [Deltaproteobacteria bacterium]|nr:sigma-70 family RNA polymerase sigma factor [Deltaproteobacteria bacterium]MCW5806299.1 sigma-70 family RNA polymerase sigma factor [Deltaproteobacteria bacterium]
MTDDLRQRFDVFVPELTARAAELSAAAPEPRPTAAELVDATWRVVAAKRKLDGSLRAICLRELEGCAHNLALRRLLAAGDLDGAFVRLLPHLTTWATNLARGVPGDLDPQELVQDAFLKLRRAPMFAAAENPLGYAFRAIKNLVIDRARRQRRTVEVADRHLPAVEIEMSGERLQAILEKAGLSDRERCMLVHVVFEKLAVSAAQKHCGGPPGAPYYVLDKILDKVAASLGITRSRS